MVGGLAQVFKLADAFADDEVEKDSNGCPTSNFYEFICVVSGAANSLVWGCSWTFLTTKDPKIFGLFKKAKT
jgi:hypothetical protein